MPYVRTRDNVELFYISASAWLSSKMWEFQIPYFVDQGFRCVAYDRRGHDRSDETWDDYDTLADDLAALLESLNCWCGAPYRCQSGSLVKRGDVFWVDLVPRSGSQQPVGVRIS